MGDRSSCFLNFVVCRITSCLWRTFKMTFNSSAAYQLSHPQDDQQNMIRIVTGVMLGVATLSMILRFVSRKMKNSPLSWEDHTMVLGWVTYTVKEGGASLTSTTGILRSLLLFHVECRGQRIWKTYSLCSKRQAIYYCMFGRRARSAQDTKQSNL